MCRPHACRRTGELCSPRCNSQAHTWVASSTVPERRLSKFAGFPASTSSGSVTLQRVASYRLDLFSLPETVAGCPRLEELLPWIRSACWQTLHRTRRNITGQLGGLVLCVEEEGGARRRLALQPDVQPSTACPAPHFGRSERVTVGRDVHQSFGVCKVHLATLKVAKNMFMFKYKHISTYIYIHILKFKQPKD